MVYVYLIGLALVIPICVNFLMTFGHAVNNNDWIGFFGSYLGAIIGGVVALLVSRMQVKRNEANVDKQLEQQRILELENFKKINRVFLDITEEVADLLLSNKNPSNNFILGHYHFRHTYHHNDNKFLKTLNTRFIKTNFFGQANSVLDIDIRIELEGEGINFLNEGEDGKVNPYKAEMHLNGLNIDQNIYIPINLVEEDIKLTKCEIEYTTLGNERILYINDLNNEIKQYFILKSGNKELLKEFNYSSSMMITPGNPEGISPY